MTYYMHKLTPWFDFDCVARYTLSTRTLLIIKMYNVSYFKSQHNIISYALLESEFRPG